MKRVKRFGAMLMGWFIPVVAIIPLIWWSGDDIEALLFPVLVNQSVENVAWDGQQLCWDWTATKARDGVPVGYSWQVRLDDGETYSVMARSDGHPLRSSATTLTGQTQTRHICIEVPEPMTASDHLIITGRARYLTWHGRWFVPQEILGVEWRQPPPH